MYFAADSSHASFGPRTARSAVLRRVGQTPLLSLTFRAEGVTLYAKAEFLNPSGSIKDRLAAAIFAQLQKQGRLNPRLRIVEVSSGNTGIAFAMLGAIHDVRVHILMSDTASIERQELIRHYGADLTLFHADQGYLTGIALADELAAADPHVYLPRQFENPDNALDHARHTAPEILSQIPGRHVDAFVAGYGTGGTLAGCSHTLRQANPALTVVAAEPGAGPLAAGEMPCCELIEGLVGGFQPPLLRTATIDTSIKVSSTDALNMTRRLAREFGLPVGPSSGVNVCAALRTAHLLGPDAHVVTILCDRAERYYSTSLFSGESP